MSFISNIIEGTLIQRGQRGGSVAQRGGKCGGGRIFGGAGEGRG